ncbi:MAG: dihydrofolate reductase family protein [Actinomycetota bacterium]
MARPRIVTLSMASVDGRLTLAPGVNLMAGDERWNAVMEGVGDPYEWARETHEPQVLLEGSGSFLAPAQAELVGPEHGSPPEGEHHLPPEVVGVPGRRWFSVVDGAGAVDLQFTEWPAPGWERWHALVLTSRAAPALHLATLRQRRIPYLVVGTEHVALARAMELLRESLGVETVVVTGGGRLGGALLRQGLVDEIDVQILPWVIGSRGTPALFDAPPLGPGQWPTHLDLLSSEELPGGVMRLRYRVVV